ncbi:CDP-diacylglycerol--glycerol-3-phosphate 3-phosphatidyltransferase [Tessaracoccus oleiagri]|uniref:CDP-diacylglycerol--glycerol-3-phosphate 3-phosphatidyltransferase n=1 Tax=Tessaracoccus oleiagri TaxID=686624 RepID=A0A1G9L6M9_9ACTN|nr:CDP-diacylglycerol--glycerol-3-phosphate 3-phosphatidyltransferase [Tessaracoccus oleiagri]SDL57639.1 CDP-diacylglycerol--glycerol-3-phosphate 3-phosphatidyltransferase [Tessaracoccus oleiagri]
MSEKPSNWNVPNVLTVIRIVLVPVMVVVLFLDPRDPTMRWAAAIIFAVAMVTDFVDGKVARKYNLVTDFGKLWDPIADKALTGAAFISLSILQTPSGPELPWFFTVIILVREWGITWLRDWLKKRGTIMAANAGGKAKTATQAVALFLFLLYLPSLPGWLQVVAWVLMWGALILTVVTGFEYIREARRAVKKGASPRRAMTD